jgi:hypothetical protein
VSRRFAPAIWFLNLLLATSTLLACMGNDAAPPEVVGPAPSATPLPQPTATPTPVVTPTPTLSPAMEGLLDPGPTAQAPQEIIFRNAGSLWTISVDGHAQRLTEGLRLGPWAQTLAGSLAAAVMMGERDDGTTTEEIRLVSAEGFVTDPIYGPVPVSGPDAQPNMIALAWSWDSTALAMLHSDGSISTLLDLNDPFVDSSQPIPLASPENAEADAALVWAPTGDGVAYLAFLEEAGYHTLFVTPRDDTPFPLLLTPDGEPRSISSFVWLPGRGRIAYVEDTPVPGSRTPSSIFTIAPDGEGLELLVSASRFAPAATIGALIASPDGRELSFAVYVPNEQGQPVFQSLWIFNIDTGAMREVPIEPGYRVTDTWFVAGGLLWRGVDIGSRVTGDGSTYTGIEPFVIGRFDAEGHTTIIFQSSLPPG